MALGRHRGENHKQGDGNVIRKLIEGGPTYQPFDAANCKHRMFVELAGRKVCNDGCAKDLGPVVNPPIDLTGL